MTSLINLLIASFLAMGTPVPAAQAATATQAPPAGKNADARQKAAFKEMLDETRKINQICTRDHFGKACIAAQEQFQRKFIKHMPQADANGMPVGFNPRQAR
jgi:hypothetical protein